MEDVRNVFKLAEGKDKGGGTLSETLTLIRK
jgi:hypothetical protein